MKIIVQPQKGGSYKLLFYDGRHVLGAGFVDLTDTPGGPRPTKYRLKWGGERIPSYAIKRTHRPAQRCRCPYGQTDLPFEKFLSDFQIKAGQVDACRMCLLDERFTPINDENAITFGKNERICLDCGKGSCAARSRISAGWDWRDTFISKNCCEFRNLDRCCQLSPDKIYDGGGASTTSRRTR